MKPFSIVAIYILFWSLTFFVILPFRPRTSDEPDPHVAGQMLGAPPRFSLGKASLWTTVLATALFALFYANYLYGWLPVEALDFFKPPADLPRP